MALSITTAPAVEPVEIGELRAHVREDDVGQDAVIGRMIKAARLHTEVFAGRTFINTTFLLTLDRFPVPALIEPPGPPLSSVTSITYIDTDGDEQTLAADQYQVDTESKPGRIVQAFGVTWPATRAQLNVVEVNFVAGYGAAPEDVPENFRLAILILAAHLYEHREVTVTGTIIATIPMSYASLVWQDRTVGIA